MIRQRSKQGSCRREPWKRQLRATLACAAMRTRAAAAGLRTARGRRTQRREPCQYERICGGEQHARARGGGRARRSEISVGERVIALYAPDGHGYWATVVGIDEARAGTYTVDWADGDTLHRVLRRADVRRASKAELAAAAATVARGADGSTRQQQQQRQRRSRQQAQARRGAGAASAPGPSQLMASPPRDGATVEARKGKGCPVRAAAGAAAEAEQQQEEEAACSSFVWNEPQRDCLGLAMKAVPPTAASFWPRVAAILQDEHGVRASAAECQRAHMCPRRFPTPPPKLPTHPKRRATATAAATEAGAVDAGAGVALVEPPAKVPRRGTIGWKQHFRALLEAGDQNHCDDIFEACGDSWPGNPGSSPQRPARQLPLRSDAGGNASALLRLQRRRRSAQPQPPPRQRQAGDHGGKCEAIDAAAGDDVLRAISAQALEEARSSPEFFKGVDRRGVDSYLAKLQRARARARCGAAR